MVRPAHLEPRPLIQFRNHFLRAVGLLGRVISPSQGLYLNKGQHKDTVNINALSGIRTHDHSVRANEDSSCVRPLGYCDLLYKNVRHHIPYNTNVQCVNPSCGERTGNLQVEYRNFSHVCSVR
jgi:hypothetical protein